MSDELTQVPYVIEGDCIVLPSGQRLPRIRGGEIDQPPVAEETPVEEAAPVDGTPAEDPEYTPERGRGLHAELTKAQQELATVGNERDLWRRAQQGDIEAMRELELPVDFGDVPDQEDEDLEAYRDPRVDAILQERAQERETAILSDVQGHIDVLLDKADIELPQRLRQAILSEAWLRGGGAQIQPDTTEAVVKEWVDEYKTLERAAGDRYIASKKAPHVSKVGTGATEEVLPLDATHAQRVAFMKERLASEEQ